MLRPCSLAEQRPPSPAALACLPPLALARSLNMALARSRACCPRPCSLACPLPSQFFTPSPLLTLPSLALGALRSAVREQQEREKRRLSTVLSKKGDGRELRRVAGVAPCMPPVIVHIARYGPLTLDYAPRSRWVLWLTGLPRTSGCLPRICHFFPGALGSVFPSVLLPSAFVPAVRAPGAHCNVVGSHPPSGCRW